MRTYETIFIVHPEVTADAYTETLDKYKGILNDLGAEMIAVEEWGNRKLAYLVKKQKRGSFVLFAYKGKPDGIRELERRFRIDEKIIKFMTVVLEDGFKPSGLVMTPVAEPAKEAASAVAEVAPAAEASASDSDEKPTADEFTATETEA